MSLSKNASRITYGCLLVAGLAAMPAVGQLVVPPPQPAPAVQVAPVPPTPVTLPLQTVQGTVDGFNRDPRGRLNSVVVKTTDGKLDQFNLPPDLGDIAIRIAVDGEKVTAVGSPERAIGDRTLFMLSKLTGADGKSSMTVPTPGVPEPTETIEGTVKRLNVSPRGEIDGAVTVAGDYVHTGAEAAVGLSVGSKLSVVGIAHPMADGHRAIEATEVNGEAVPQPPLPPAQRPGPAGGPLPLPPVPPQPGETLPTPPVPLKVRPHF